MFKLYDYFRSSACFRVRIALNLKKIPFETIPIHLLHNGGEQFSEAYTKINPQALVPTFVDHQRILTQSLAIIEYLDDIDQAVPLLPTDPYQKALVRSFALSIAADIHPLNNLRVLTFLKTQLNITEEQKSNWYQHWISVGLSALEKQAMIHATQHSFCFGNTPTLADICLIPQMYNAKRFGCDLKPYPRLIDIDAYCQTLPEFTDAYPIESVPQEISI